METTKPEATQLPIVSGGEKLQIPTIEEVLNAMRDLEQIIRAYPVGERTPEEDRDIEAIAREVAEMQRLLNERRAQLGVAPLEESEQAIIDNTVHVDNQGLVTSPEEQQAQVQAGEIKTAH